MPIDRNVSDVIYQLVGTIRDLARRLRRLEGLPLPSRVSDLLDVEVTSATIRQYLRYDGTNWVNETISSQALFTIEGNLTAPYVGTIRIPNVTGRTLYISQVYIIVETAPVGDDIIVDVCKNGTTIFANPGDQPTILDGTTTGSSTTISASNWTNLSYLTIEIDQIGSGTAGANLTVAIVYV